MLDRTDQIVDTGEVRTAFAKGVGGRGGQLPQAIQAIDAHALGVAPQLIVKLATGLAHFTHIADHHDAAPRHHGQHIHRGLHRIGIGVVGIVKDEGAVLPLLLLQAAFNAGITGKRCGDGGEWHPGCQPHGRGRQRVPGVVQAGNMQGHADAALRSAQIQQAAQRTGLYRGTDIRRRIEAETQMHDTLRHVTPDRETGVIQIKHGNAIRRQSFEDFTLGAGNCLHRAKPLQMGTLGVVHNRHGGRGDACEIGNLAGVIHAHLDHCGAMRGTQTQQGQRQADVVVEIALGGQHGIGAEMCRKNRGAHFLDRSLAIAPCHTDQGNFEAPTPLGSKLPQCEASVLHHDHRADVGMGCRPRDIHQDTSRARGQYVRHEIMGVETLATECNKELPRPQGSGIRRYTIKADIGTA